MSDTARDRRIGAALADGFKRHGCDVDFARRNPECGLEPADLAVFVGVRRSSSLVRDAAVAAGQPYMMLDKGYFRRSNYHRFSVGTPQPTYVDRMDYDRSRLKSFGVVRVRDHQYRNKVNVVYVESTQKYYDFHCLGDVDKYTACVCAGLVAAAKPHGLRVLYRPRGGPGRANLVAPPGTVWQGGGLMGNLLASARCLVTHGSNAGVEAMIAGVPVISLGSPDTNPIHDLVNSKLTDIVEPRVPSAKVATNRLAQLAWCQFSHAEVRSGLAWEHIKRWVPK